jgi:LPXTG-site transpeptidase (sortase) family protein
MKYLKLIKTAVFIAAFLVPVIIGILNNGNWATTLEARDTYITGRQELSQSVVVPSKEIVSPTVSTDVKLQPLEQKETDIPEHTDVNKKDIPAGFDYLLSIPKIDIDAPVLGLGLESDGKMDVPDNYTDVGWYSLGTKPGGVGNAVLGAHVDNGSSVAGVFKDLKKVTIGDSIYVYDELGRALHYRVVARDIYDYRVKDTSSVFRGDSRRLLKLITCHGNFLQNVNTYDSRLVVTAELV